MFEIAITIATRAWRGRILFIWKRRDNCSMSPAKRSTGEGEEMMEEVSDLISSSACPTAPPPSSLYCSSRMYTILKTQSWVYSSG